MGMYIFIVNPVAGNGRSKRIFKRLEKSERYKDLEATVHKTTGEGHAEVIAKELVASAIPVTGIIVIGGDGTLHETINGLDGSTIPISFIPGGSGNDFARGVGIKGSPEEMLERAINIEHTLPYWTGAYLADKQSPRQFINSMGFGFDAEVAEQASKGQIKHILNRLHLGTLNYIGALLQVLFRFKPFSVELECDGKKRLIEDCWMITIANQPYYGGGMKIIPNARVNPNTFDVLVLHSISKWKILALFMTIFTGKHVHFKEVSLLRASTIRVHGKDDIPFHVDGQTDRCARASIEKTEDHLTILGAEADQKPVSSI